MNIKSGHIGSGSYKLISGWILNFYIGCANKTMDPKDILLNNIQVPVRVKNYCTGLEKTCYVVGGFHGVKELNDRFRPVMSISVIEDLATRTELVV